MPHLRRPPFALVSLAAGALLISACGKDDQPKVSDVATTTSTAAKTTTSAASSGNSTTTTSGGGSSASTTTSTTAAGGTVKFNQVINYEGFVITLHDGTTDTKQNTLTIPIDIENPGTDNATFYGDNISLDDGSTQLSTSVSLKDFVSVLAGSKGKTDMVISLPDDPIVPAKTFLAFGQGSQEQVRIPFPGNSAKPILLAPVPQTFTAPVTVGDVTLTPSSAEVRYDSVDDHKQLDKGNVAIVVRGKAKNASTDNTYYWGNEEVTLSLPDGSKQQADVFNGKDFLTATKTVDFEMVFVINTPFAGQYGLDFTAPWTKDGAPANAHADLTLAGG
jgi:hypothetical protein